MGDNNYSGSKKPALNFRLDKGGVLAQPGPFVGEVMQTTDPTRSGRIRVWIKTFGDEETKFDESSWITVRYLSPFYGITPHKMFDAPDSDFETNGQSYGMWMNVPDVGVEVLCVFADGDPNQGYYVGCIPVPQMNHMVPATGAQKNPHYNNDSQADKLAHAPQVPVTEIDRKEASMKDANFLTRERPVHSVVAGQMWKAGTIADTVRGPITSSSQRETPSRVYGISTPGRPIYTTGMFDHEVREKLESGEATDTSIVGRKGGHSFIMDDGNLDGDDNLIRIRTSTGHQITMSDNAGVLYIAHGNGHSWIEFGAEGTVDVFAANSINLRSGGDVNIHADHDINLNAGNKLNGYAKNNITVEAEQSLNLLGKTTVSVFSNATIGIKSNGSIALDTSGTASILAGGPATIIGSRIGLNDGSAASVTAPSALTQTSWPDAVIDDVKGWISSPGQFKSIVTRAPTHEPYDSHSAGVTGNVVYKATAKTKAVSPLWNKKISSATVSEPVEIKELIKEAQKPNNVGTVSSLTKEQVTGVLAQRANTVNQPADVVTAKGLGTYGLSKQQLEEAGILKSGIGMSTDPTAFQVALTDSSVFTGQRGVTNIDSLLRNESLQSTIMQESLSNRMTALEQSGVITGNEDISEIASLAGAATQYDAQTIQKWKSNKVTAEESAIMDRSSTATRYAVSLVDTKTTSIISNVQSGSTTGAVTEPAPKTNTIATAGQSEQLNELIGSPRIEPAVEVESVEKIRVHTAELAEIAKNASKNLLVFKDAQELKSGDY
jgi:hypothetical protein